MQLENPLHITVNPWDAFLRYQLFYRTIYGIMYY